MTTLHPSTSAAATLDYGAAAFKDVIKKNTERAFLVTVLLLLFLVLYNFTFPLIEAWLFPPPNIVKVKLARVSLSALPPPPSDNAEPPPPPPTAAPPAASGPAARAGTPVPVPDALIPEDMKDFANVDEINRASAIGGEGEDWGGFADGIGQGAPIDIGVREAEPNLEDFVAVEKEPGFDFADLQRRVRYPDMARRNGIEGQVLVAALVGRDGSVEKTQVISSDNEILNSAALAAVRETVFTPAIQNQSPVRVWVRIPISFKLR